METEENVDLSLDFGRVWTIGLTKMDTRTGYDQGVPDLDSRRNNRV